MYLTRVRLIIPLAIRVRRWSNRPQGNAMSLRDCGGRERQVAQGRKINVVSCRTDRHPARVIHELLLSARLSIALSPALGAIRLGLSFDEKLFVGRDTICDLGIQRGKAKAPRLNFGARTDHGSATLLKSWRLRG